MGIQIPLSTEDNVKANTIGLLIHDIDRMGIESFAGNNDLLIGKIADSLRIDSIPFSFEIIEWIWDAFFVKIEFLERFWT